ncbi:hypothetical protein JW865_03955 [Candidatus Bathyarchaeota archaeon]|nr:hypothetical protein [Candidatus Bathyarchaeota archaeon]
MADTSIKSTNSDPSKQASNNFLSKFKLDSINLMEISLLILILSIAIILRVLPLRWGAYLNEYDPFFWYRSAEYIVNNGFSAWFTWHDSLAWYPIGKTVSITSFPGNPFSAAFIYFALNTLGLKVTLMDVCLYFPILMAVLTCIVAYFFGKELGGKPVGILTAFLMAINPAYLERTGLGFFDTENIGIFGMMATGLFLLKALKKDNSTRSVIGYSILSGLSMGYAFSSWGAARYIVGLVTLYIVITMVIGRYSRTHLISYSITMLVGFLIASLIPVLGVKYILNIENLLVFAVIATMIFYEFLMKRIPEFQARLVIFGIAGILFIGMFTLPLVGIGNPIASKFLKVLNPFEEGSPLFSSVAEHAVALWSTYFYDFGIVLFLSILGLYFALKKINDVSIFSSLFLLTCLYFAGTLIRLKLLLAFPASLMAAYGLVEILQKIFQNTPIQTDRRQRRRLESFGMDKRLGIIFILLLSLTAIPYGQIIISRASQPGSLASSGNLPLMTNGTHVVKIGDQFVLSLPNGTNLASLDLNYTHDWIQALSWMNTNLSSDAVVASWWDYGYWIETMANKTTLANGSTSNTTQIVNLAKMMIYPHNTSLPIMQQYDVDYVVVFITFNPNAATQEYPWGDNGKWGQMALIAGFEEKDFYIYGSDNKPIAYSSLYTNSTIGRLMHKSADAQHYELVYESQFKFVLVYKVKY